MELDKQVMKKGGSTQEQPTSRELAERLLSDEFLSAADLEPLTLTRIGRYDVLSLLGQGSAGQVFLAHDGLMNRQVAIKLVKLGLSEARVRQEIQTLAQLEHPGVVSIYDVGVHDERPFLVMAHAGGSTLANAKLTLREWVEVLVQVLDACNFVHSKGVIHRDLKPANIILGARPVIADFGIAKLLDADANITNPGQLVGTPAYMAPEQFNRGELGPWTDTYAAGAMLYERLCGKLPVSARGLVDYAARLARGEPVVDPAEHDASAPSGLARVALRALAQAPGDRYPSAAAMAVDLRRWLEVGNRSLAPIAASGAVFVLLLVGVLWALAGRASPLPPPPPRPPPEATSSRSAPEAVSPPASLGWLNEQPTRSELPVAFADLARNLPQDPSRDDARAFARACWKIIFRALDEHWKPPGEIPALVELAQRPPPATVASGIVASNTWLLRWWFERDANGRTRPSFYRQTKACLGPVKGEGWEAEATAAISFLLVWSKTEAPRALRRFAKRRGVLATDRVARAAPEETAVVEALKSGFR